MEKPTMRIRMENNEVCWSEEPVTKISEADLAFLKEGAKKSKRNRFRVCAHNSQENKLHEMIVVYTPDTYVWPNWHRGIEESMHVVSGSADFVLFDEVGKVIDVIPLGEPGSGRNFYMRAPHSTYHTVVVRSEFFVCHETTEGPFRKTNSTHAPWAPPEDDVQAVSRFRKELDASINKWQAQHQKS
jgi:cupin fold WbuC family metalloprotein